MQNSTSWRGMDVVNVSVAPLSIGKEYRGGIAGCPPLQGYLSYRLGVPSLAFHRGA